MKSFGKLSYFLLINFFFCNDEEKFVEYSWLAHNLVQNFAASSELTYTACIHGSLLCICPSQPFRREGMLSLFLFLVFCIFGLITHVRWECFFYQSRFLGKCCCKCTTFCMRYQEMIETVTFITGMDSFFPCSVIFNLYTINRPITMK